MMPIPRLARLSRGFANVCGGPGGWDVAAKALGMGGVGIEWDKRVCATRGAAGHWTVREDAAQFDPHALRDLVADLVGVVGSPPCRLFSAAGAGMGRDILDLIAWVLPDILASHDTRADARHAIYPVALDYREEENDLRRPGKRLSQVQLDAIVRADVAQATLVLEPPRYIAALRPEWVALEQVVPLLPLWKIIAGELRDLGYSVWTGKVNAANYGVPQTRTRAILIASRVRDVTEPPPTHYDPASGPQILGRAPWVSMRHALGMHHVDEPWVLKMGAQTNATERGLDEPAPTIAFGNDAASARWVLPGVLGRRITVAEASVLQSFPAAYPWQGRPTSQYRQVSDVVPPLLGRHVLAMASGAAQLEAAA